MKIVFFGTPEFAAYALDHIVGAGYDVAAVVTATDKPAGRGHKLLPSAVKQKAIELGLPLLQPERLKSPEFIESLREIGADLFVVIAFRMLPESVWAMPPKGTFNLHASLLPRYRGAAPINHAIINGDTKTGVTTFFLDRTIDTGEIIMAEETPISSDDTAETLHDRLMELGAEVTLRTLDMIAKGTVTTRPQDDVEAKPAPKIFPETCRIDWSRPAEEIHNLVRGLSPYPAARADIAPIGEFKVMKTRPTEMEADAAAGTVKMEGKRLLVAASDYWVEILELQPKGRSRMDAKAFLNGFRAS